MTIQETLDFMRHHPWNFYYVDPIDPQSGVIDNRIDKGYLNHDGYFGTPSTAYADRRLRLDEIGSMINVVDMPSGWYGIDKYDFGVIDHMFSQVLDGHPDRYMIPRMHLDAPTDWLKAHPEEVCVFAGGPQTAEAIAAAVGTDQYDPDGSSMDPRKTVSRQSFSSQLWLEEACIALRKYIDHIENSRWAKQTIGYMVMFGECGENMWWGVNTSIHTLGDYGITHRKRMFEWAVAKYGSLPALRKAWHMPHLTSDSFALPTLDERWPFSPADWQETKNLRTLLLADDQRQVDCNEFFGVCTIHAIEELCKIVHELSAKPAGAFYGYTQTIYSTARGHSALDTALASPYIDFMSAPKCYSYMLGGEPGESQGPAQSIARQKLWVEENDCRSHHVMECNPKDPYSPRTREDAVTCYWRELYRSLTYNYTFWWMNIYGLKDDWYSDEPLIAMFKQQADFFKRWSPIARKSVTEILVVEDDASAIHVCTRRNLTFGLRMRLVRELKLCGAPVDHLRLPDLLTTDLSQYKFIVFQEGFVLPHDLWKQIQPRLRADVHILWNYAAALLDPAYNPENQHAVTGFTSVETTGRMQHKDVYRHVYIHGVKTIEPDYPHLSILPEAGQEALQTTPDGHLITARIRRGEGASIYAADLTLRTPLLRRLLEDAGVTLYAPENCSVLADEKLIGFFPRYDVCFTHVFDGQWRNVITGEMVTGKVKLTVRGKKFAIFEKL